MMTNSRQTTGWAAILTFVIILGWMPFEGILALVVSVGILLTGLWAVVGALHIRPLFQTSLTGTAGDLWLSAVVGGASGLVAPLLIVGLMVLKTGIHSHGAEFSQQEIEWVLGRFLPWSGLGAMTGLGIGLLVAAVRKE